MGGGASRTQDVNQTMLATLMMQMNTLNQENAHLKMQLTARGTGMMHRTPAYVWLLPLNWHIVGLRNAEPTLHHVHHMTHDA